MQDGKAIKMLATASRLDIEDFLQKKVYLEVITSAFHPFSGGAVQPL
jgi:GTPase Era involved in 16S rRNA processing